jgi:type II secretory pathway component PulM
VHVLLASAPALPLGEGGRYVAGAYIVFLILIVVYVAIMAAKLQRIEKELRELAGFVEQRQKVAAAGTSDEVAGRTAQGGQGVGASADDSGSEAEQSSVGAS